MINIPYEANCYIKRNKNGQYSIVCDFFANNKWEYAKYSGNDFTEGLNSIIASLETSLKPKEPTLEEKYAALQKENETLKKSLDSFTAIENKFEKKLNESVSSYNNVNKNSNQTAIKDSDLKKAVDDNIKNNYGIWYDYASDLIKKIDEETKDMTDEEYFDYVMKLIGLKK